MLISKYRIIQAIFKLADSWITQLEVLSRKLNEAADSYRRAIAHWGLSSESTKLLMDNGCIYLEFGRERRIIILPNTAEPYITLIYEYLNGLSAIRKR